MLAYTTPARLAGFMGITLPTGTDLVAMQGLINAVTRFINDYTSRDFTYQVFTRYTLDTERGQTVNLPAYPVDSTQPIIFERRNSQLQEDKWEVIDQLYYDVDYDAGILYMMNGTYIFRGKKIYRITFTAGFNFDNVSTFLGDTNGADIEYATWLICQDSWKTRGIPTNMYSEKIGDYQIQFQRPSKGATGFGVENPQAQAILDKYVDISPLGVLSPLQSI